MNLHDIQNDDDRYTWANGIAFLEKGGSIRCMICNLINNVNEGIGRFRLTHRDRHAIDKYTRCVAGEWPHTYVQREYGPCPIHGDEEIT